MHCDVTAVFAEGFIIVVLIAVSRVVGSKSKKRDKMNPVLSF